MSRRETMEALRALKRDTGIDYTHADPDVQEEQADLYLAVVAAQQALHGRPQPTEEELADRHDRNVEGTVEQYRRNGWQLPRHLAPIDWDRVMTVRGAAEALGVNRQRVHQLLNDMKLDGQQVDGLWLVDAESVKARLAEQGKS